MSTRDVYDEAIDELIRRVAANPMRSEEEHADDAWCVGPWHLPLFDYLSLSRNKDKDCGCLTQVKSEEQFNAINGVRRIMVDLSNQIRADNRIPQSARAIVVTRDGLEVFAEYQREYDKLVGRKPPVNTWTKGGKDA